MKKVIYIIIFSLCISAYGYAQSVNDIMNNIVAQYTKSGCFSADFSIRSKQFNTKGTIIMNSDKFRILSQDYKCWYDGKTQWVYTPSMGEVGVIEPTLEELEQSNPYLAVMSFKKHYAPSLKSQDNTNFQILLKAIKKDSDIYQIELFVRKSDNKITKTIVLMRDGSIQTISFSNYNDKEKISSNIFKFDKQLVPAGTQLNDLR